MAQGEVDALNRVFRVTYRMSVRNQQIQLGYHLRDVLIPNRNAENAADDSETFWNTNFKPALSNDVTLQRVEVQRVNDADYFAKEQTGNVGTLNLALQSTGFALAVTLKSPSRRRNRNGRFFWPAAGSWANDTIAGGALNTINAAAAALVSTYTGLVIVGDWQLVVVGKAGVLDTGIPLNAKIWTDVTSIKVNPVVSSLRSRKVGIGA